MNSKELDSPDNEVVDIRRGQLGKEKASRSMLHNQSLAKAFSLLDAFDVNRRSMNLPELADATGLHKSTVQRLTHTLESLGYMKKDPWSKRYSLGPRVMQLGMRYTTTSSLIEIANPYLLDLNIRCAETIYLSEPYETSMIFVASFLGRRQISVLLPLGSCYPMYCTAAGRAYLSGLPQTEVNDLLQRSDIRSYTPATILSPSEITRLVDEAREMGYAYAKEEFFRGDFNIAAPIFGPKGQAIASVGVSVPMTRWTFEDTCSQIAPQIMEVARVISRLFAPKRPT